MVTEITVEEEIRKDERNKIAAWHDRQSRMFQSMVEYWERHGMTEDAKRTQWAASSHAAHATYIRQNKYSDIQK